MMSWWENIKQEKKLSKRSYFFFCWLSFFRILPSGLFASQAGKKKSRIARYVISFHCTLCVFSHRHVQWNLHLIWMPICQTHPSFNSVFLFSSEQRGRCSTHSSPLWCFWRINMYWQASTCMPVHTDASSHIHTSLSPEDMWSTRPNPL